MFKIEEPEWDLLYSTWRFKCEYLYEPILTNPGFIEVYVPALNPQTYVAGIDWWPMERIDNRRSVLQQYGIFGRGWEIEINTGTRTTADMLWELRINPEGMAAVWNCFMV